MAASINREQIGSSARFKAVAATERRAPEALQRQLRAPMLKKAVGVQIGAEKPVGIQERRRRRRVRVPSMYSFATVRILAKRLGPIEGYVVDLSESGIALELDDVVAVGQVVTVEFHVAGLGAVKQNCWADYTAVAEVVRHDYVEDFPGGPYRVALRFVQVSTMTQAQVARFVATQAG